VREKKSGGGLCCCWLSCVMRWVQKKTKGRKGVPPFFACAVLCVCCAEKRKKNIIKSFETKKNAEKQKRGTRCNGLRIPTGSCSCSQYVVEICKMRGGSVLEWESAWDRKEEKKDGASNKMDAMRQGSEQKRNGKGEAKCATQRQGSLPLLHAHKPRTNSKKQNAPSHNHKTRIKKRNNKSTLSSSPPTLVAFQPHKNQEHGMN